MEIEYLVSNDEARDYLLNLPKDDDIEVLTSPVGKESSHLHVVSFMISSKSIRTAKRLAKIRDELNRDGTVLVRDDPSKRFETDLYSLIADFERELRRILALYRALNNENEHSVLDAPEKADFGRLFSALFIDESFNNNVKRLINQKGHAYEKDDLIRQLSQEKEEAYWDTLFPAESMPTIRNQHDAIRGYRNDVMHSHRMSTKKYMAAKRLLTAAIKEMVVFSKDILSIETAKRTNELTQRILTDTTRSIAEYCSSHYADIDVVGIMRVLQTLTRTSRTMTEIYNNWTDKYEPLVSSLGTSIETYDTMQKNASTSPEETETTESER